MSVGVSVMDEAAGDGTFYSLCADLNHSLLEENPVFILEEVRE